MPDETPDILSDPLWTPREVAAAFRVHVRTLSRWTVPGPNGEPARLTPVRTAGGHRRYRESEVRALLRGEVPRG